MNTVLTMAKEQKPPVSSSILGVIMVIIVEIMFFGGLISAYVLAEAGQVDWPPADQPRLPFWLTFGNMLILIFSAFLFYNFLQYLKRDQIKSKLYFLTILTGSTFFLVQGYEWLRILIFGMKTGRGLFSSFFYTIIGLHGFHVMVGLILLVWGYRKLKILNDKNKISNYSWTVGLFWFFVVLLWPILYYLIYWV